MIFIAFRRWWLHVLFLPFDCFGGLYGVSRLLTKAGPNVLVGFAANAQGRMQGLVLRNACSCSFTFTRFPHNRCILKGVVFRNVCNHSFIFIALNRLLNSDAGGCMFCSCLMIALGVCTGWVACSQRLGQTCWLVSLPRLQKHSRTLPRPFRA